MKPTPEGLTLSQSRREKALDVKIVTWKENDPDDPRNWGFGIKWFRTVIVSYTCFVVAMGSSLVVMDMEKSAAEFNVSIDVIHLTVAVFVFGFGIGPLLFSPLSEIFGRRPIIVVSMGLYFIFTFPSAFAQNAATLVVGRAIAGLAASAPMTVIGGCIADMWEARERGWPMAAFSGTLFVGPCLGPIIAGYLTVEGWRANYYLLLGLAGSATLAPYLFLPETYAVVLLRRRAIALRKETGDEGFMTTQERFRKPFAEVMKTSLIRPLQLLVTEPIIFLFSLYLSLIYALLYLLFFAIPVVFQEVHHWSRGSTGLAFIAVLLGMLGCFATLIVWQSKYVAAGKPNAPPEARLPSMMVGSITLPIGFFILAWCTYEDVHWIGAAIGCAIFGFSMIGVYVGANSYIVDAFPEWASSAMAAKTLISRLCGGAIPMFVDRMYHSRMGPRWSSCLLAFISLAMMPIPFVFFKYGARIRAASKRSSE
ncbi:major facilitator superfamily domain-containing protein [Mrakia frigida]|uniref:MFS transporter n=1 Tax=Mrakia frigida TaxID=29902 RepID=UPI003FCC188F